MADVLIIGDGPAGLSAAVFFGKEWSKCDGVWARRDADAQGYALQLSGIPEIRAVSFSG